MLCFEVAVITVTFIWLGLVVFAGVSFVIGLLAVYWAGALGLAAAISLVGVGRKLLRPKMRDSPR